MRRLVAALGAGTLALTALTGVATAAQDVPGGDPDVGRRVAVDELEAADVESVESLERGAAADDGLGKGEEPRTYLVRFAEEPAPSADRERRGELRGESLEGGYKFDADEPANERYVDDLEQAQVEFVESYEREFDREIEVPFTYQYAVNGMAAVLTPAEAREIAQDDRVIDVRPDEERELHTDQGPARIAADQVWQDTDIGLPEGYQGEGMIVGIIDTGISPSNPSFADVGDDGYDHVNPLGAGNYLGVCDSASPDDDPAFPCNDKLIGAYAFLNPGAEGGALDDNGHGSHTASTAAGNVVDDVTITPPSEPDQTVFPQISGVAPHANIVSYMACCSVAALTAAIDQAIEDEVDVINYSIGSSSPSNLYSDFDTVGFLEARRSGIFVATSNGNDGPGDATTGSPSDAPWITSVGATTHDRYNWNALTGLTRDDATTLPDIEGKSVTGPLPTDTELVYAGDVGDPLCEDTTGHEAQFDGKIVVCDRGVIGRVQKSFNVAAQGAVGFVHVNDEANGDALNGDPFAVPGVHISYDDGQVLKAWLAADTGHVGQIAGTDFLIGDQYADEMAAFSSRGPNRAAETNVPDVVAPGVDILAAVGAGWDPATPDYDVVEWDFISGTSMASPHVAGAGALLQQIHGGEWTPAEMQSALMMTAVTDVTNHDGGVATPYAMGSGRVHVGRAATTGLVMDVPIEDYDAANPAEGGDFKTLNLPSFENQQCLVVCAWQRTAESVADTEVTWTVGIESDAGLTLTTDAASYTVAADGTFDFEVTADVDGAPFDEVLFGRITMTPDVAGIPDVTFPVAATPTSGVLPPEVAFDTRRDAGSGVVADIASIEVTDLQASLSGFVEAVDQTLSLSTDPTEGDPYDVGAGGVDVQIVDVPAGTRRLVAEITDSEAPDIDLYVGFDADGEGDADPEEEVAFSAGGSFTELVDISDPQAGDWWILVQNWEGSGAATEPDDVVLSTALVPQGNQGNGMVVGPGGPIAPGVPYDLRVVWDLDGAEVGSRWFGVVELGTDAGSEGDIGSFPVTVTRLPDDVTKTATPTEGLRAGDTVTYDITIAPNATAEDLVYTIEDTVPAGMTLVPGSVTDDPEVVDEIDISGDTITWTVTQPTPIGFEGAYEQAPCPGSYLDLASLDIEPVDLLQGDTVAVSAFSTTGPFPFYGGASGGLTVAEDGLVTVDGGYGGSPWIPQALPDPNAPNGVIAPLWSDLEAVYAPLDDPGGERGVTLARSDLVAIIEYDDLHEFTEDDSEGPSVGDFQVWVWNYVDPVAPEIEMYYGDEGTRPSLATIGVENLDGTVATAVVNADDPSAVATDGGSVCFDYIGPGPITVSFQATVDAGTDGTVTNTATHDTNDPYSEPLTATADVEVTDAGPVTVDFTAEPNPVEAGVEVAFEATGDDPAGGTLTYEWDFGDGESATGSETTHTYEARGEYVVTVTATSDVDTATTQATETVVVWEPPTAAFSYTPATPTPADSVAFDATASTDPEGGPLTYEWDFGDGASVTGATPSHSYAATGTYTVELTVTSSVSGLAHTTTQDVTVTSPDAPSADAGADKVVDRGETVAFNGQGSDPDGGPVTYAWDFGDGTEATGQNVTHAYDRVGNYTATLTVTDDEGDSTTDTVAVHVLLDGIVDGSVRAAGTDRIQTSILLSQQAWEESDTVILARADDYPDALAATTLGSSVDAPVLQTPSGELRLDVAAEIERLGATTAYLMGGEAALGAAVETALEDAGITVERLAGADRFETAALVADEIVEVTGEQLDDVVLALGVPPAPGRAGWADALASGTLATTTGAPVLLSAPTDVPEVTMQALADNLAPGGNVWIVGGPAVLDAAVDTELGDAGYAFERLYGADRYGTVVAVLTEAAAQGANLSLAVLASGQNFPDALSAAPAAWKLGGFLILVHPDDLAASAASEVFLSDNASLIDAALVAGGNAAVSDAVVAQVEAAIAD